MFLSSGTLPVIELQYRTMAHLHSCHSATFHYVTCGFYFRLITYNLTQSVHSSYSAYSTTTTIVTNRIHLLNNVVTEAETSSLLKKNFTRRQRDTHNVHRPFIPIANCNPEPPNIPTSQRQRPRYSIFRRLQLAQIRQFRPRLGG